VDCDDQIPQSADPEDQTMPEDSDPSGVTGL
jgi:hypothetical protein